MLLRTFTRAGGGLIQVLGTMKIIVAMLWLVCLPVYARECMAYSETATLVGKLTEQTFPGPPNYEDIASGDSRETYMFVSLQSPVCVAPGHENSEVAASNVRIVQLIFPFAENSYDVLRPHLGQKVTCTGHIWPRETGHHHSRVLLEDAKCMVPNNSFKPTAEVGLKLPGTRRRPAAA